MLKKIFVLFCALALSLTFFCRAHAQEFEKAFSHGNRETKCIALTFDDGPHPRYTDQILALLKKYDIRATFFMIGSNVAQYPQVARRVAEGGHEIGNHTYSHPHMLGIDACSLMKEIQKTEKVLAENGIKKPNLFRPPEGYRTREQCISLSDEGYRVVVWSLDTHDWRGNGAGEIVKFVTENAKGGDIVLFHDYISGQNTTIAALEELIPKLISDGYQFVTVSELMGA